MIERSTAAIAPAVVRRAEEYMEANLARAISIADVAAACGCSRTKLFDATAPRSSSSCGEGCNVRASGC